MILIKYNDTSKTYAMYYLSKQDFKDIIRYLYNRNLAGSHDAGKHDAGVDISPAPPIAG